MEFQFSQEVEDGEARFDVTARPGKDSIAGQMLVYSTCIRQQDGQALLTASGEIVPEYQQDGALEVLDELSLFGFGGVPVALVDGATLVADITLHTFSMSTVPLSPVTFAGAEDIPRLTTLPEKTLASPVSVIGQQSKYSVESGKKKRVEFLGSSVIVHNPSEETVYVTYYVGTKAGSLADHLGRIGLEQLLPGDSKTIAMEIYYEQVNDALGLKIMKPGDLSGVTLHPFLCVFTNRKTRTFSVPCT
jgi:hypothetical protein